VLHSNCYVTNEPTLKLSDPRQHSFLISLYCEGRQGVGVGWLIWTQPSGVWLFILAGLTHIPVGSMHPCTGNIWASAWVNEPVSQLGAVLTARAEHKEQANMPVTSPGQSLQMTHGWISGLQGGIRWSVTVGVLSPVDKPSWMGASEGLSMMETEMGLWVHVIRCVLHR
jgi:hypothetical protein